MNRVVRSRSTTDTVGIWLLLLWLCSGVLGCFRPATAEAADNGQNPRIRSIRFAGNEHLSNRALRGVMRLKQPAWYRLFSRPRYLGADFLAGDLNSVLARYRAEGFSLASIEEARVRFSEDENAVEIEIAVEEGPRMRVGSVTVTGLGSEARKAVRAIVESREGEVLRPRGIDADREAIANFHRDRGQLLFRSVREFRYGNADTASILLHLQAGPYIAVDSIVVGPTLWTRPETVTRELAVKPGQVLTQRRLLDSRKRLLDTGLFTRVNVVPQFPDSSRPERAWLVVDLAERKRARFESGAGFNSESRGTVTTRWSRINLGGRGRSVSLSGETDFSLRRPFPHNRFDFSTAEARVGYLTPRLVGTRNRGIISGFVEWVRESRFDERSVGVSVTARREINRTTRVGLTLTHADVSSSEPGVDPRFTSRTFAVDWSDDRRDSPFDASTGQFPQLQTEFAGGLLGGDLDYGKYVAVWRGYQRRNSAWVLAGRVMGGYIAPYGRGSASDDSIGQRIPFSTRFRLGGSGTVRGYGESEVGAVNAGGDPVGGLAMGLANVELRFPIYRLLRGVIFADAGNTWTDPDQFKLSRFVEGLEMDEKDDARARLGIFSSVGLGLRYLSPVGPVRVDYGVQIGSGRSLTGKNEELHVGLGQAF
ncbi:MAG: BamA/TamA family outer membrane protein [Candidatus Eisenbacteria bacterium]|nr:BamA/TamA family outer membrane protein [Candidatus Eisenbacteria bacterium]